MFRTLSPSLCAILVLACNVAVAVVPTPNQLWQFNNTINGEIVGGSTGIANGAWTPTYTTNPVGLPGATVINMPDFAGTESFLVNNNVGANGGSLLYTNNWTLMMDIMIPDTTLDYISIMNTSPTNSNDVDIYGDKTANNIEYWDGNTAGGVFTSGTWYRWTIRREVGVRTNFYQNGVLIPEVLDFGTPLDGHVSLESVFHLFGDDNGQNNAKFINSVGYWGEALSDADIASLGGPTAAGIEIIPEPNATLMAFFGAVGTIGYVIRRKS